MATMAKVIREAVTDFAAKKIGHVVHGGPPPPDFNDHIAAAVAAHMLSEAVVERMAQRICQSDGFIWTEMNDDRMNNIGSTQSDYRAQARAAITAALGEHEGVGR